MESIKVLAMVEEAQVHDLKRRELIKYVLKLRKFVVKQSEKLAYQKQKITHLVGSGKEDICPNRLAITTFTFRKRS